MDAPVYCIHCGATIPSSATFCPTCGKSQSGASSQSPAPEPQASAPATAARRGWTWRESLVSLVIIGVIGGGAFIWFQAQGPALSDAASNWCRSDNNLVALESSAKKLGIDGGDVYLVVFFESHGQEAGDKIKAEFARACNAAFDSR